MRSAFGVVSRFFRLRNGISVITITIAASTPDLSMFAAIARPEVGEQGLPAHMVGEVVRRSGAGDDLRRRGLPRQRDLEMLPAGSEGS